MNVFFGAIADGLAVLNEEETRHLFKVLRLKPGDEVWVTNGYGIWAKAKIDAVGKRQTTLILLEINRVEEQKTKVNLYVAPPKSNERWEFILEKATEIGVWAIHPVLSFHSERKHLNTERGNRILQAAAKQSLKAYLPILHEAEKLQNLLPKLSAKNTFVFHCHTDFERQRVQELTIEKAPGELNIFIGPEGDFSAQEIQGFMDLGIKGLSLGDSRLRTETAAMLAVWEFLR